MLSLKMKVKHSGDVSLYRTVLDVLSSYQWIAYALHGSEIDFTLTFMIDIASNS